MSIKNTNQDMANGPSKSTRRHTKGSNMHSAEIPGRRVEGIPAGKRIAVPETTGDDKLWREKAISDHEEVRRFAEERRKKEAKDARKREIAILSRGLAL